jgi:hypothetical protein
MPVLFYDKFFNIPRRGVLKLDTTTLAFLAEDVDYTDEPEDIANRPGVYTRVRAFEHDPTLLPLLSEQHAIFWRWRAQFDAGLVESPTHPLYVDERYQLLSAQIDEHFGRLGKQVLDTTGLMVAVSGQFVFETL